MPKFTNLEAVTDLEACPSVDGAYMQNISFAQAEEYETLCDDLSDDLDSKNPDAVRNSMKLILWLFVNVLRGKDGSRFDDIETEQDCWDKVPVRISRLLFADVTDAILGGKKAGN